MELTINFRFWDTLAQLFHYRATKISIGARDFVKDDKPEPKFFIKNYNFSCGFGGAIVKTQEIQFWSVSEVTQVELPLLKPNCRTCYFSWKKKSHLFVQLKKRATLTSTNKDVNSLLIYYKA
ncbi:hypothetical protein NE237_006371 [Protea cynaroides]|uniref:Uncharacterized protein n=1 Tax=Protea cynaroides TaxID=273540 RepID=A0A9Q0QVD4_9MAGN|nr:hypothetical protein NE237_006371 [Protea cynaroides]